MDKQGDDNGIAACHQSQHSSHRWYVVEVAKPVEGYSIQQHQAPQHGTEVPAPR